MDVYYRDLKHMGFRYASLIYNPASGQRQRSRQRNVERARQVLAQWIPRVELLATAAPGDATRLAREAVAEGCDLIAPCGGDGTINEVIAGMAGSDAVLLPLPSGTANVLADEVGLPMEPEKAAALLPDLSAYPVRVGAVEFQQPGSGRRPFLLMCGCGVDASIVYHLNGRLKSYIGQGAYWLGSLERLQRPFESFGISIGGKAMDATLAVVSKSRRYGGGLILTPRAHLLAENFEVAVFRGVSPLRYVGYLAQIATGTLDGSSDVSFYLTDRVEFTTRQEPNVYIEVDGELAGRIPAAVELTNESVRLLLPPKYAQPYTKRPAKPGSRARAR